MCDVGQGDALVLATGEPGRAVLLDAGPDGSAVDGCLARLGVRSLALVVLSHLHADHVDGLAGALRGRSAGAVALGPVHEPVGALGEVTGWARAAGVPVVGPRPGGHAALAGPRARRPRSAPPEPARRRRRRHRGQRHLARPARRHPARAHPAARRRRGRVAGVAARVRGRPGRRRAQGAPPRLAVVAAGVRDGGARPARAGQRRAGQQLRAPEPGDDGPARRHRGARAPDRPERRPRGRPGRRAGATAVVARGDPRPDPKKR